MPISSRAHNWIWVLNNPEYDPADMLVTCPYVAYAVWQLERGESGTEHFQGCLFLSERKRGTQLKSLLPGAHLQVMRGTSKEATDYCDGTVQPNQRTAGGRLKKGEILSPAFKIGDPANIHHQGERSDLHALQQALANGDIRTARDYRDQFFPQWFRNRTLVGDYHALDHVTEEVEPFLPNIYVALGPARAGKTTFFRWAALSTAALDADKRVYRYNVSQGGGSLWWDHYGGERTVSINDFVGKNIPFADFKKMFDHEPFDVQVRGNNVPFSAKNIFISSNDDPIEWYPSIEGTVHWDAVRERITKIYHIPRRGKFYSWNSYDDYALSKAVNFTDIIWKDYQIPEHLIAKAYPIQCPI